MDATQIFVYCGGMKIPSPRTGLRSLAITVALSLAAASAAQAVTIAYYNDFSGTGGNTEFPTESTPAQWTVVGGNYNNTVNANNTTSFAVIDVTNAQGANFVLETRFNVNAAAISGGTSTLGFAAFGDTTTLTNFYLADFTFIGTTNEGRLRILNQGSDTAGFTEVSAGVADANAAANLAVVLDTTYTLRLTGTYTGTQLNLSLGLFDAAGLNQIGTSATSTDTTPLTGQYFGIRNRTGSTAATYNIDFEDFSIVPEPGVATLAGGALAAMALLRRRRARC